MHKTMFSDEVVLATDLKKRQRYWFDRARASGGVTIMQGGVADLVLAPRQKVAEAAKAAAHARTAAQFLREVVTLGHPVADSTVFPWLSVLDAADRQEFVREFVDNFAHCATTNQWTPLEELLEDWQATAEAHRRPELMENWRTRGQQEDYEPLVVFDVA